jgi:hypothetical protein
MSKAKLRKKHIFFFSPNKNGNALNKPQMPNNLDLALVHVP